MSKYTTEVRYILESFSGLPDGSVEQILDKSWFYVFDSDIEFFDPLYRPLLCKKILRHYYTREIAGETFGLWKLWINTKLAEIMPLYNQLYKSQLIEINPLYTTDLRYTGDKSNVANNTKTTNQNNNRKESKDHLLIDGSKRTINTETESKNKTEEKVDNDHTDAYSDTPQGSLTGVNALNYLTNARKIDDTTNTSGSDTTNATGTTYDNVDRTMRENEHNDYNDRIEGTENENINSTETYVNRVYGNSGRSSASLIKEYRDTLINIDMMVISEFSDCFLNLW